MIWRCESHCTSGSRWPLLPYVLEFFKCVKIIKDENNRTRMCGNEKHEIFFILKWWMFFVEAEVHIFVRTVRAKINPRLPFLVRTRNFMKFSFINSYQIHFNKRNKKIFKLFHKPVSVFRLSRIPQNCRYDRKKRKNYALAM